MLRVLFVCGKNRWRSPTAEELFSNHPGVECHSAGLSHEAPTPLSAELVQWAELICVMEKVRKAKLASQFKSVLAGKRVVCLGIPDRYAYMDPALVQLLLTKVSPLLPHVPMR